MARNKRGTKIRKEKKRKKIAPIKLPTKKILQVSIACVLIPSFYIAIKHSYYFNLADIKIIDRQHAAGLKPEDLLKRYRGLNIFDIDIASLAARIENNYPVIEHAVARRVLPNRLEVTLVSRIPVAVIDSYERFPIDRTGMVLPPSVKSAKLPVISGLSIWASPRPGERLEGKQLEAGFLLLDALKESSIPSGYNVSAINIADYRNPSFYFENGIEVKIGSKNFSEGLKILKATLAKPDLDKNNIKYIDLRFRDVVIGPK